MKKTSPAVVVMLIAVYLAAGVLLGILMGMLLHIKGGNWCFTITVPLIFMCFIELTNLIMFPIAKRTMNKGLKANNFGRTFTYVNKRVRRIRVMLCIDEENGRVALTSALNPFKFQMVDARELTKIRSCHDFWLPKGTRCVFFEFYHVNNRIRIPTYTVRHYYAASPERVQEAIDLGDKICNLLLKFNPRGYLTADKKYNIELPFIKIGIPGTVFACVSMVIAVVAMFSESVIYSNEDWKGNPMNGMIPYVLTAIGVAFAATALVLGIKGLMASRQGPVRGLGLSKLSVIMSSIVIVVLLGSLALFLFA